MCDLGCDLGCYVSHNTLFFADLREILINFLLSIDYDNNLIYNIFMKQIQKRRIRNIFIKDLESNSMKKRISGLTSHDKGVNFYFELPELNEDFMIFAQNLIGNLSKIGIDDYKLKVLTLDENSNLNHLKVTTRVLKTNELEKLIQLEEMMPENAKVLISEKYHDKSCDFSLNDAIFANEFVNEEVNYIKSLKLSPFEEYLMAYDFTSSFFYNDDEDDTQKRTEHVSRLLTSALTNEYFVCSAYAKVFCGVLAGLGIDSVPEYLNINIGTKAKPEYELHVNVLVDLKDLKYGIDGIVFTDACNDARKAEYITKKSGEILLSVLGETGYILSAVNICDIQNMKSNFTFDEYSSLKFLYGDTSALLSDDFKCIFNGFEDEDFLKYLEFFTRKYPEFNKINLNMEDIFDLNIIHINNLYAKNIQQDMISVFGNLEVATSIEKCDISDLDETIVVYNSELSKLYKQAMILKISGISDEKIHNFISSQKREILSGIDSFDKEYEVDRVFRHNEYIASKYGNDIHETRPIRLKEFLNYYTTFGDDYYSYFTLFCFSRRKEISEFFENIKRNSPSVKFDDYFLALCEILKKQGFEDKKIAKFAYHRLVESARTADMWFDKTAKNCFLKYSNKMWDIVNNEKGK